MIHRARWDSRNTRAAARAACPWIGWAAGWSWAWPTACLAVLATACPIAMAQPSDIGQVVAFVQPDAQQAQLPLSAFRLLRQGQTVKSEALLMPCDVLRFDNTQTAIANVVVTSARGGRNQVLSRENPELLMPCDRERSSLSSAALAVWRAVSAGERATDVRASATRGTLTRGAPFDLPLLSAPRSQVVAGRRALRLVWKGGTGPFEVVLARSGNAEVIARATADAHELTLPEVDIAPGRYSLTLSDLGEQPIQMLREDELYAVRSLELPAVPAALANAAALQAWERELVYLFYLEGVASGSWTLEVLQRMTQLAWKSPTAADWVRQYGDPR